MKKFTFLSLCLVFMVGCVSQPQQTFYEKQVVFPADATLEQLFAYFVEVCRGVGYYPESFHALIKELF